MNLFHINLAIEKQDFPLLNLLIFRIFRADFPFFQIRVDLIFNVFVHCLHYSMLMAYISRNLHLFLYHYSFCFQMDSYYQMLFSKLVFALKYLYMIHYCFMFHPWLLFETHLLIVKMECMQKIFQFQMIFYYN